MYEVKWQLLADCLSDSDKVLMAWVFGSAQSGRVRPGSDLDIAILFDGKPGLTELAELRARLQQCLEFEDIDLLVLNDASPIARFEAISGSPVFCRDLGLRAEFASLTAREYEDEMAMVQRALASYYD